MKIHLYLLALTLALASQVEAQVIRGPGTDVTDAQVLKCELRNGVSKSIEIPLSKIDRRSKKMKLEPSTFKSPYGEVIEIRPEDINADGKLEMVSIHFKNKQVLRSSLADGDIEIAEGFGSDLRSCSVITMKENLQQTFNMAGLNAGKPNSTLSQEKKMYDGGIFSNTPENSPLRKGRAQRQASAASAVPTHQLSDAELAKLLENGEASRSQGVRAAPAEGADSD